MARALWGKVYWTLVFRAHRERIEHEARRKYLDGHLEPDGSILIRTQDL